MGDLERSTPKTSALRYARPIHTALRGTSRPLHGFSDRTREDFAELTIPVPHDRGLLAKVGHRTRPATC
ncbi:hypothetical protein KFL01_30140 [Kocuria flava]|uniref:Uncharacterized protein n=1 Tax=Kocuria flava TaxID=446860 RepID=A0ABQ0X7V4_9MICC|nr:hypothetical protein KFL01_30140 [Kocuria flava]